MSAIWDIISPTYRFTFYYFMTTRSAKVRRLFFGSTFRTSFKYPTLLSFPPNSTCHPEGFPRLVCKETRAHYYYFFYDNVQHFLAACCNNFAPCPSFPLYSFAKKIETVFQPFYSRDNTNVRNVAIVGIPCRIGK